MPNAPSRSTSGPQMSRIISTVQWPSTSERRYAARASSGRNGSPSAVMASHGTAHKDSCKRTSLLGAATSSSLTACRPDGVRWFDRVTGQQRTAAAPGCRDAGRHKQNVVDLHEAVDTITRAGLDVMGGFIVGFDADGPEAFAAQREFIGSSPVPLAMVGLLTALPGTQLWRRLESEGRLRDTSNGDAFTRPNFETSMGEEPLLAGYKELMRDLYSAQGYYARCHRVIERVGPPVAGARFQPRDLMPAARAIMGIGILGERRGHFWRLLARGLGRGHHALRRAFMFAIHGELLIRYTEETVVPRIERALAQVRETPQSRVPRPVTVRLAIVQDA